MAEQVRRISELRERYEVIVPRELGVREFVLERCEGKFSCVAAPTLTRPESFNRRRYTFELYSDAILLKLAFG